MSCTKAKTLPNLRLLTTSANILPDGAEQVCLDRGVRRWEVLEAAEDVRHGVGGHAGEVLTVSSELIAESAKERRSVVLRLIQLIETDQF